jgi:hypothetical protein
MAKSKEQQTGVQMTLIRRFKFESQLCHFLAKSSQATHGGSWSLSCPFGKREGDGDNASSDDLKALL